MIVRKPKKQVIDCTFRAYRHAARAPQLLLLTAGCKEMEKGAMHAAFLPK